MKILCIAFSTLLVFNGYSQTEGRLDEKVDRITYDWDIEADKLSTYEGLRFVCENREYKNKIVSLLDQIHHYDSVLYRVLLKLSTGKNSRELRQTLEDIQKFEEQYNTKSFIEFMHQECLASGELERNVDEIKNDVRESSYSGRQYIIETELYKYVRQVTKRIDKIRLHIHHISNHY